MKKIIIISLAVLMCFSMFSCSKAKSADDAAGNTVQKSSTAPLEVSTTKKPAADSAKAKKLSSAMVKVLGTDKENVSVSEDGSFEYKLKSFNEIEMYSMEYTHEIEKSAYKSIDRYVDSIRAYYPDGDKIKLYSKEAKQINYGDNGIDSVNYTAVYINTQNQKITVYADSTGELYYAKCDFTW